MTGHCLMMFYLTPDILQGLIEVTQEYQAELVLSQKPIASNKESMLFLLWKLQRMMEGEGSWSDKYDKCWEIKDEMFAFEEFQWSDPDMDYEDYVRAFYSAADEYINNM